MRMVARVVAVVAGLLVVAAARPADAMAQQNCASCGERIGVCVAASSGGELCGFSNGLCREYGSCGGALARVTEAPAHREWVEILNPDGRLDVYVRVRGADVLLRVKCDGSTSGAVPVTIAQVVGRDGTSSSDVALHSLGREPGFKLEH